MSLSSKTTRYVFLIPGALLAWFALIAQLYLIILNRNASVAETVIRYFSFFTILTNILVALCLTSLLLEKGSFFRKSTSQAAIAVYILVVGLVYNIALRSIATFEGLDRLVNELLHCVVPALFILYWLIAAPKKGITWKHALVWLIYPFAYLIYTLIRGSIVHFYPYPFLNVPSLGYPAVLVNCLWVTLAFVLFSLLFVAIARKQAQRPGSA